MTAIKQEDLIQSVADAFQYISYYHPLDYIKALGEAYEREESPAAKDAIAQILTNSRMSAEGHRPICQDTGIGMVFIKVGMQVTWPDATMSIQKMIDEGVRRAYANPDNPLAHYRGTGPEIWRDTGGRITHFVSSMGTTGTIMGTSAFLKLQNPAIQIIGCQPMDGSQIPGIRKWPEAYLPRIYDKTHVDRIEYVSQADAEAMTRRLATEEGIFSGISSGGALAVALRLSQELENATIVSIVCDRGDRYLSTGVFPA